MNKSFEIMGYWYLPNNPHNKVAGTLTYTPNQEITLSLFDIFYDKAESKEDYMLENEKTILGISFKGEMISLLNCWRYHFCSHSKGPFNIVEYKGQLLIINKHIHNMEDIIGSSARVRFDKLSSWCPPPPLDWGYLDGSNMSTRYLHYPSNDNEQSKLIQIDIDDELTLSLCAYADVENNNYQSFSIMQGTSLNLKYKSAQSLTRFNNDIYLFKQFLSFAMMQDVSITNICITDKDENVPTIKVFNIEPKGNSNNNYDYLLENPQVDNYFPKVIRAWYHTTEEFNPIKGYLIDVIKRHDYSTAGFLQIIQAIDGYWQRFMGDEYMRRDDDIEGISAKKKNKRISLETEIAVLTEKFSCIPIIKDTKWDYKAIVDTRNHFSHLLKKGKKKSVIYDSKTLRNTTERLSALLTCCILAHLGIDEKAISTAIINAVPKWRN